jgi:hypothetical protein
MHAADDVAVSMAVSEMILLMEFEQNIAAKDASERALSPIYLEYFMVYFPSPPISRFNPNHGMLLAAKTENKTLTRHQTS